MLDIRLPIREETSGETHGIQESVLVHCNGCHGSFTGLAEKDPWKGICRERERDRGKIIHDRNIYRYASIITILPP